MHPSVSGRRDAHNYAHATVSAPTVYLIVGAKIASPDAVTVVLRGQFDGPFDAAKRHALTIARTVAERHDCPALAEVLDAGNALLFAAEVTR